MYTSPNAQVKTVPEQFHEIRIGKEREKTFQSQEMKPNKMFEISELTLKLTYHLVYDDVDPDVCVVRSVSCDRYHFVSLNQKRFPQNFSLIVEFAKDFPQTDSSVAVGESSWLPVTLQQPQYLRPILSVDQFVC